MGFRVRGVRMWLGDTDAREDADCWPLREIVSLCGLDLGSDRLSDCATMRDRDRSQLLQHHSQLFLATIDGKLVQLPDDLANPVVCGQDMNQLGVAGR